MHNHPGFWITDFAKFRVSILEGGGGGGSCCVVVLSCGCCPSSAFSSSFCRSRLYPLPLKHVAASTAACFNFSFADGCFNVWSPLSPICPCAIQLTSAERPVYDSTFSSSLSSRSARKTQVRSRKKNIGTEKNTFGSRKKTPCSGKKLFPQREKTPAKNAASQREKFKAAEKAPCSSTKAPLQQKKCILEAAGKNRPRQEENWPRQEKKKQQQRKSSFATQKVAATEKIHFRNGKKQQPIQLHLQGCDSTLEDGCNLFILLFTLRVGVGMVWFFNLFARVAESPQDNDTPVLEEPTMNEINDDEDGSIRMSHIGAAIIAANSEFPSSNVASSSTSIRDPIEMPVLRDEGDLPEPYTAWSPEAMLTFMYSRCLRRKSTATSLERQYEERLQLLCNVMNACTSGDQSVRLSAAVMARNMTDLSSDEESPNYGQSWIQLCNTMDEVEHAMEVGQSLANSVAIERATTSDSSHVDSIARALMENIDNPPMDEAGESEDEDSDEMMETNLHHHHHYHHHHPQQHGQHGQ